MSGVSGVSGGSGPGPDAVIIGTGPNGLAAGVTLARAGLRVELYEAAETVGGGLRSLPLFDSQVLHDICAAVHPMAAASPFFRAFDLAAHGVELRRAPVAYGHPLPTGPAALAWHDLETTVAGLGVDGPAWRRLMAPLVEHSPQLVRFFLSDQRTPPTDLATPLLLAERILRHGTALARHQFRTEQPAALLAGVAAHAVGRLPSCGHAARSRCCSATWRTAPAGRCPRRLGGHRAGAGGGHHRARRGDPHRYPGHRPARPAAVPGGARRRRPQGLPRAGRVDAAGFYYARQLARYRYG